MGFLSWVGLLGCLVALILMLSGRAWAGFAVALVSFPLTVAGDLGL